jgi:biotin carboxyl carrier protein
VKRRSSRFPCRKFVALEGAEVVEVRSVVQGRIADVLVSVGDTVAEGDDLMFVESMKMEVPVSAPSAALVRSVLVAIGDAVEDGTVLVVLD